MTKVMTQDKLYKSILSSLEEEGLGIVLAFENQLAFVTPTFSEYCAAILYLHSIDPFEAEYLAAYAQFRVGNTGFMVYWPMLTYIGD